MAWWADARYNTCTIEDKHTTGVGSAETSQKQPTETSRSVTLLTLTIEHCLGCLGI
jgi:hypothetical protein